MDEQSRVAFTPEEWQIGIQNQLEILRMLWQEHPNLTVSEYAEKKRIMPPGTPYPGQWRNSLTPYLVEPMNNMCPQSPIRHTVIMAGAQVGKTAALENVLLYWMDYEPTAILFISATDDAVQAWATKRLEPALDSCGLREKFAGKGRRTGDNAYAKEFYGGWLRLASAQAAASLRADSVRLLIRDEIDGAPIELKTGEGDWMKVSAARTRAWGSRAKILDVSTPKLIDASLISEAYEAGDRRKYFVPCPFCGREQILEWERFRPVMRDGLLEDAVYECENRECRAELHNHHKTQMLAAGRWVPTARSSSSDIRSYWLPSQYSPVGMYSWCDMYRSYIDAQDNPTDPKRGMQAFVNLSLGLPYKETGTRPDLRKLIALRGTYRRGEVQSGVIYLTAGIDVQRGSEKDPNSPPRLEMEVLGHGRGYKTWSTDYRVFRGPIDDPYAGAWEELNQWALEGGLIYRRADGAQFSPAMILVDSSDGNVTNIVYGFCGRWRSTFPCKGAKVIIADPKKREVGDVPGSIYKRWRIVQIGDADQILYEVNTQFYKQQLYRKLNTIPRQPTEPQASGFCDFPLDYEDEYFAQLASEEQLADGSFRKVRERNESLDCRVYAMCAADVFLMGIIEGLRKAAREAGATLKACEEIKSPHALSWLEQRINIAKT